MKTVGKKIQCSGLLLLGALLFILISYGGLPWEHGGIKHRTPEPLPEDDRIEDKNPEYDPRLTAAVDTYSAGQIILNKSQAVIGLDITDLLPEEKKTAGRLYPNFAAALEAIPAVKDRYAGRMRPNILPSVDMIDAYTKYTDDRLLSAIETALSTGPAVFPGGKQGFLRELATEILTQPQSPERDNAATILLAAWELGGGNNPQLTAPLRKLIDAELARFDSYPEFSKPVGIYTATDELTRVFRRDRLLQQPFGSEELGEPSAGRSYPKRTFAEAVVIARALDRRPDLYRAYLAYLTLAAGITNPAANLNFADLLNNRQHFGNTATLSQALCNSPEHDLAVRRGNTGGDRLGVAFWPFATSKENQLFARIYRDGNLPSGNIMDDVTGAIRSGMIDLAPTEDSGWYDYQLHALETLLLPDKAQEADKLLLTGRYKQRLKKAFEAMMTLRRELHVKEMPLMKVKGGSRIPPTPNLTVEPAATNFLRTARGYAKLRRVLSVGLANGLDDIPTNTDTKLLDELDQTITTFFGLYIISCDDLGMMPEFDPAEFSGIIVPEYQVSGEDLTRYLDAKLRYYYGGWPQCISADMDLATVSLLVHAFETARHWLGNLHLHPAMQADPRVIVPVLANADGSRVRYWAVTGITFKRLKAWYATPPQAAGNRDVDWDPMNRMIPVYAFAEIEMGPEPLSREEFQALCNQHRGENAIKAALEGPGRLRASPSSLIAAIFAILILIVICRVVAGLLRNRIKPPTQA